MFYNKGEILETFTNYIGKPNKTNCYLSYNQLKKLLETDNVQIKFGQKGTYIFIEKEDYIELLFFVQNIMDLFEERDFLKGILPLNKKVIISIIEKDKKNDEHEKIMEGLGFSLYKKYVRKKLQVNGKKWEVPINENICFAEANDIDVIQSMINITFDSISDQIPSREELEQMIFQKQVWKYTSMDSLKGFLISERQGKKSYLRMLCIGSEYRGSGIGKRLLQEYIMSEYKYVDLFYLWVDGQNTKAIELYEKQGYVSDGLDQYIYIH